VGEQEETTSGEPKLTKEECRQLQQASRKLLRTMCHMRSSAGYRDRPIIDILSTERSILEFLDYPLLEMMLTETLTCLKSLPPSLKQNDFELILQHIESSYDTREIYHKELAQEKQNLLVTVAHFQHVIGNLEREEDMHIEYLNSARLRKFRDTYTRQVERFVEQFKAFNTVEERRSLISSFLGRLREVIHNHPLWQNASSQEVDFACIDSERYLMRLIFSSVFSNTSHDQERDEAFARHLVLLQGLSIEHESIGLPLSFQQLPFELACKELKKINDYHSPHDKLECIWRCCQIVSNLHKLSSQQSEDIYFKLLVYVTLLANPPRLLSNTSYINNYASPEQLNSEPGFWFIQFCLAVNFLRNIDPKSLKTQDLGHNQLTRQTSSSDIWQISSQSGGNKVSQAIRTPSMMFKIRGVEKTSIDLKRRRGDSFSSPLSSPRERHSFQEASKSPPPVSSLLTPPESQASNALSPRSNLRHKMTALRSALSSLDSGSPAISSSVDLLQMISDYKDFIGAAKAASSQQEH